MVQRCQPDVTVFDGHLLWIGWYLICQTQWREWTVMVPPHKIWSRRQPKSVDSDRIKCQGYSLTPKYGIHVTLN